MLHADQDGEKLQALLRLLTELLERVRVVEALSTVPQMYCLAVVEVVRRKMFIGHYRQVTTLIHFFFIRNGGKDVKCACFVIEMRL